MNLGLPGFRAHDLNHCSVANLAGHVERTGMGVLGSGRRHLCVALVGGSVEVSGMWRKVKCKGLAQSGIPLAEIRLQKRICFGGICMGRE